MMPHTDEHDCLGRVKGTARANTVISLSLLL
jgi:hypothetical protein